MSKALYRLNRPAWMKKADYIAIMARYGGDPCCDGVLEHGIVCCSREDLTFDHIVPRSDPRGTDDISNIQVLCRSCNSSKRNRPDVRWGQKLYFDREFEIEKFRAAQRHGAYEAVQRYSWWFEREWSQISGRLYLLSWVVGAGKTLGVIALNKALNDVVNAARPFARRVRRVLFMTKETAIRDQAASSFVEDVTGYGILDTAPQVHVIKSGADWSQKRFLDQFDIVACCVQQLFLENGRPREDIQQILGMFDVIVFDELHFAWDQIRTLVSYAHNALCFGLTGTPIDAKGAALDGLAMLSTYTYQNARDDDGSMKFASDEDEHFKQLVSVFPLEESVLRQSTAEWSPEDEPTGKHSMDVVSACETSKRVLAEMVARDAIKPGAASPHRGDRVTGTLLYPAHAMIVVDTIDHAKHVVESINAIFEADKHTYPRSKGYSAAVVHSGDGGERLTTKHPWLASYAAFKKHGHVPASVLAKSSRILVVVGMAREGVNNPFCTICGLAKKTRSVVEVVQLVIGRLLRAVRKGDEFPPQLLDTIRIVTHEVYGNDGVIMDGLRFVLNQQEYTKDIPTIEQISDGFEADGAAEVGEEATILMRDRVRIISAIGGGASVEAAVDMIPGSSNPGRRRRLTEWAETVRDAPEVVAKKLRYSDDIEPVTVVMSQKIGVDPTPDELARFLEVTDESGYLLRNIQNGDAGAMECATKQYAKYIQTFHAGEIKAHTSLAAIRNGFKAELYSMHGELPESVHAFVGKAMKLALGVPSDQVAGTKTDWDIPQYHAALARPDVRQAILGWVQMKLMRQGHLSSIASALRIDTECSEAAQ